MVLVVFCLCYHVCVIKLMTRVDVAMLVLCRNREFIKLVLCWYSAGIMVVLHWYWDIVSGFVLVLCFYVQVSCHCGGNVLLSC